MTSEARQSVAPGIPDPGHAATPQLGGRLGTWSTTLIVLAFLAPLGGVIGYVPLTIGYGNGLGAPLTYIVVGVALLLFAVGYSALVRTVGRPGAFYAYIAASLGRQIGLGASLLSLSAYLVAGIGFFTYGGIVTSNTVAQFGGPSGLPWWIGSLALACMVAALSYRGAEFNARVMITIVVFEVIVILAFNAVQFATKGFTRASATVLNPANLGNGSMITAIVFVFVAYVGFEVASVYFEEMRNPRKTVGRATYAAVISLTLFYVMCAWAFILYFGADNAATVAGDNPAGSFLAAIEGTFGHTVGHIVAIQLLTSVLASVLSIANVAARYVFSLGIDRVLPEQLARVHAKTKAPSSASLAINGLILGAIVLIAVTGIDPVVIYSGMAGASAIAFVAMLALVSLAVLVYFRRDNGSGESWLRTALSPGIGFVFFLVVLVYAVINVDQLTGPDYAGFAYVLISGQFTLLLAGIALARWLKHARPQTYQRIGRSLL